MGAITRGITPRSSPEAGTDYSGSLQQLLAIGSTAILQAASISRGSHLRREGWTGDGATAPAGTWFQLGGAGDKSIGWHNARILGMADLGNPGMVRYEFYIDGLLGGSVANLNDRSVSFNWLVLGSGLTTVPKRDRHGQRARRDGTRTFFRDTVPAGRIRLGGGSYLAAPESLISSSEFLCKRPSS